MASKFRRAFFSVLILLGFVAGCGTKEPEIKLDPATVNKPFPKAGERQTP